MVFADSSALIAGCDPTDADHARAARAWWDAKAARERVVTTNLVFAETVTYVRRRVGWSASRTLGDSLLRSRGVEIAVVDRERFEAGWRELLRSGDPTLSLCDAVSFVVMRERGIRRALTFDRHFTEAGFETLRVE